MDINISDICQPELVEGLVRWVNCIALRQAQRDSNQIQII